MAHATKIVPMPRREESLSPELRDFLDVVIVPALLRKYEAEAEGGADEKSLASVSRTHAYSRRSVIRRAAGGKNGW
ncbi:MAG TPA: hypothetical protein VMV59_10135 [Candidatus Dormibacteraeota bacterium]|nr:hypothetical protein [Candidatus Dormibacteraeota bacterium]